MRINYQKLFPWQSEFDHRWACWATNHNGWRKMKKMNRRLAKRREKAAYEREKYTSDYKGGV